MMKADIFIVLCDFADRLEEIGEGEIANALREALAKDRPKKEKT